MTSFGSNKSQARFGIRIALHMLEGDDAVNFHDKINTAGYPALLDHDIGFIKRHNDFFFGLGFLNHLEQLESSKLVLTKKYA